MDKETKCRIIGAGWIFFAVIIFAIGYFYFLANKESVLDLARCTSPQTRSIIESIQAPLDCNKELPFESWVNN